ncbi:ABC transporter substrate-binding protein [Aestuariivita sp.]|jgi:taurine transport system substrate-binding protein|uniref:taurine ABC transporter substrate-binding protein n=1 Tax=Aestuariivita sp. TaxID=1872407 RepID=UPI0021731B69|nr:ABC transporter substrate-binding protein [Aestuariivita sp.]MCE8007161.1 ABC transporter substrate-binding protein [Aestuariivita sp.]
MKRKQGLSRRDLMKLSGNIGLASLAVTPFGLATPAFAQDRSLVLSHFASVNPQNYARATGSLDQAFGDAAAVEFRGVKSGPDILTGMAAGAIDMGNMGSSPMIVGMAQGLPISMIYVHKIIRESEALIVREGAGIDSLEDLRGRKVGTPFNTSVHFAVLAALDSVGLSTSDVELVNLRPDAIVAAWSQGAIDAAYIWTSVLAKLEQDGGQTIFTTGDLAKDGVLLLDGFAVRNRFKEENPDLVLTCLRELARIDARFGAAPDEVAQTMTDFLQIDRALVQRFIDTTHTLTPEEQASKEWMGLPGDTDTGIQQALQKQAQFMLDTNQIMQMPDLTQYIDSSFIAQMLES